MLVAASSLLIAAHSASATPLLINGNFETGSFSGWTVGSTQITPFTAAFTSGVNAQVVNSVGGNPAWFLRNTSANYFGTPASPISGYTAFNGFDGSPGSLFLQQNFVVGGPLSSLALDFDYAVQTEYSGLPRVFSVNILNTGGSTLATVFSVTPPSTSYTTWTPTHVNLDLASTLNTLGPGTYQLQFLIDIPQNFTGPADFGIDNISLDARVPEGGNTLMMLGLPLIGLGLFHRRLSSFRPQPA